MKLNRDQIAAVRRATGLRPLPESVSAETGLAEALGDQTFYVEPDGVYVFDEVEHPSGEPQLMGIRLAEVEPADEDGAVTLRLIAPRGAGLIVDLAA